MFDEPDQPSMMLGLAVQPPQEARPGVPLYPPVALRLSSERDIYEELSHTWAVATLVHKSGNILHDQLGGKVADSAHPLPDRDGSRSYGHVQSRHGSSSKSSRHKRDRAYFYFPDLVIHEPGRYKIRVSLMEMDYSMNTTPEGMVTVRETVETRSIIVQDKELNSYRPSSHERAFLRTLKDDGQDVPSL